MIHMFGSAAEWIVGVEFEISLKCGRLCMEFIIWQVAHLEIVQKDQYNQGIVNTFEKI